MIHTAWNEKPNICVFTYGRGAPTTRGGLALVRSLCPPSVPDYPGQCWWRVRQQYRPQRGCDDQTVRNIIHDLTMLCMAITRSANAHQVVTTVPTVDCRAGRDTLPPRTVYALPCKDVKTEAHRP